MADATKTSAPPAGRGRLLALCGAGAFIVVGGMLLPKLMTPAAPTSDTAPAASSAAVPGEIIPAEWRPLVDRALVVGSVAVLLGVGAAWLVRRPKRAAASPAPNLLNVIAALPLPNHCCAYLVRVGDRQFLAGVDAGGIRSMLPLPSPPIDDAADEAPDAPEPAPGTMRVFA